MTVSVGITLYLWGLQNLSDINLDVGKYLLFVYNFMYIKINMYIIKYHRNMHIKLND